MLLRTNLKNILYGQGSGKLLRCLEELCKSNFGRFFGFPLVKGAWRGIETEYNDTYRRFLGMLVCRITSMFVGVIRVSHHSVLVCVREKMKRICTSVHLCWRVSTDSEFSLHTF